MKLFYIISCAVSILVTFISSILLVLPNFYASYDQSTMHIDGYGTSIYESNHQAYALTDINPAMCVVFSILTGFAIALLVLSIIFGCMGKTVAFVFLAVAMLLNFVPGVITLFSTFGMGTSKMIGVSGAFKEDATHFNLGPAGGWFVALKAISFVGFLVSFSALITYRKNEYLN